MAQEFNIEDYDDNFDFGFSIVDETEVEEYDSQVPSRVADETGKLSATLEGKLDALWALKSGDTTRVEEVTKKRKEDLLKVEKLIMPLLYNLMKNPDDIYIKWPNRKTVIEKQVKKIVAITRS